MSGCSSGVEHNLAKVGVGRSNRLTRSILSKVSKSWFAGAFVRFDAVEIAGEEATQKGAVTLGLPIQTLLSLVRTDIIDYWS